MTMPVESRPGPGLTTKIGGSKVKTTHRTVRRLSVIAALAFTTAACASVAQLSNIADPQCATVFEDQLTSILVQQGEGAEVSSGLASRTRLALASANLGPRSFLVSAPSGTDYAFFVQAKRSTCLLRLYGRRKGFMTYTNNLTYIETRPLPACTCEE